MVATWTPPRKIEGDFSTLPQGEGKGVFRSAIGFQTTKGRPGYGRPFWSRSPCQQGTSKNVLLFVFFLGGRVVAMDQGCLLYTSRCV